MDHHNGTLTIDTPEGYCECPAVFQIAAEWSGRNRTGYRSVNEAECLLIAANLGALTMSRGMVAEILGCSEVERQEELALGDWMATASEYDADEWGDYMRDQRSDRLHAAE